MTAKREVLLRWINLPLQSNVMVKEKEQAPASVTVPFDVFYSKRLLMRHWVFLPIANYQILKGLSFVRLLRFPSTSF